MISFISFSDEFAKIAEHWLATAERELAHKVMKTPGALAKATSGARKDVYRAMDSSAKLVPGKTVTKVGSIGEHLVHGAELGGLGILAHDSYKALKNPKSSAEEKGHAKKEVAGLGVLALPSVAHFGSMAAKGLAKVKKGSATKISMPTGTLRAGALQGAHMAKNMASGGAEAAQKMKNLAAAAARNKAMAGAGTTQFAAHSLPVVQGKLL